jgi:hypothetical protein
MTDGANKIFMDDPLLFLMDVPVFDPNKIMRYDPLKVKKSRGGEKKILLRSSYFQWYRKFYNLSSRSHHVIRCSFNDYRIMKDCNISGNFTHLYMKHRSSFPAALPDFRNCLYWSPEVKTMQAVKANKFLYFRP